MEFRYDYLYDYCKKNKDNIKNIKSEYINLLSMLTYAPDIPTKDFIKNIQKIDKIGKIIICYHNNMIIGSGTIIFEPKLIHGCQCVGHIEDIIVHKDYRSKGIAKNILDKIINLSYNNNCYKVILNCKEELVDFYIKAGFEKKGIEMAI